MSSVFILTLGLSLAGGATCLLVLAAGALVKNSLKSSWLYFLWLIVLMCFIVPVPLNPPFASDGLKNVSAALSAAMTVREQPTGTPAADDPAPAAAFDEPYLPGNGINQPAVIPVTGAHTPATEEAGYLRVSASLFLRFLPYVWLAGAGAALLWTAVSYAVSASKLRAGRALLIPGRVPVYESARVTTPILTGLLRPAVYLPAGFPYPELAIRHELCHLRRSDLWVKWIAQLTLCAHWFNPLAYLMRRELNRLSELACDEAVIRRLDPPARRSYGRMLLEASTLMSAQKGLMFVGLGKDKRLLKERIKGVMKTRKTTKKTVAAMTLLTTAILFSALIFGALFSGCATAPVQASPEASENGSGAGTAAPSSPVSVTLKLDVPAASPSTKVLTVMALVTTRIADLPFDGDAGVKGTWLPVGEYDSVSSFVPPSSGAASAWELAIAKDGHGWYAFYTQHEGFQEVTGYPRWDSAVSYEIKELDGKTYLFIEEKDSGGVTDYFVFEKLSDTVPAHNSTPPGNGDSVLIITDMS